MNATDFRRHAIGTIAVALFATLSNAHANDDALARTVAELSPQFAQQQWQRLSQTSDRDDLIAALLIASSQSEQHVANLSATEQRLAANFSSDPMALFALALACQSHHESCAGDYYQALVKRDPNNAVNWLLRPAQTHATADEIHSAARATSADTQLRAMMKITQAALTGQRAPHAVDGVDARQLAEALSNAAMDAAPLPLLGSAVLACRTPAADLRDDCITLARKFIADKSESLIARMVGSAMLRRLEKGTSEETAAIQMRRDYVWLDEQLEANLVADKNQLHTDMIQYGEWSAWLRAADRAKVSRKAPDDWTPRNPQTLLLSEERTTAPAS